MRGVSSTLYTRTLEVKIYDDRRLTYPDPASSSFPFAGQVLELFGVANAHHVCGGIEYLAPYERYTCLGIAKVRYKYFFAADRHADRLRKRLMCSSSYPAT